MRSSFTIFIAFEQIKDKDNVFSLTVFTQETDYPSETNNLSSKSVKIDG